MDVESIVKIILLALAAFGLLTLVHGFIQLREARRKE